MTEAAGEIRHQRTMQHLQEVADLYAKLLANGNDSPGQEIARRYDIRPATARSWIHRARQRGLLPTTTQGKAKFAEHQPRRVSWGADSWEACTKCHREWPCPQAPHTAPLEPGSPANDRRRP